MIQRKSILFLTRLYHPHIGGVEKHVDILSKLLTNKGFSVTIVTEKFEDGLADKETVNGIQIMRIPVGTNPYLKKFFVWKWVIIHIHLFVSSDIIHIHDVFYWILPFVLFLRKNKLYTTFHGYEGYPIKKRWILQRKLIEKLSNGTICIGDFMKKWYKANPSSISYGGVRLTGKNKVKNQQSAVFFGRLDSQTGILEYIASYKKLKKLYPKFAFTVVGEGEFSKNLPRTVKKVNFNSDVEKYLSSSRFVFVSRYLSMLEALALKKEVIAVFTDPVMKDYLLMSPFKNYIDVVGSHEEITEAVVSKLQTGGDEVRIQKGYEWAIKNTWEKVLERYLRLWGMAT